MLNYGHLRYFWVVARDGNLTRAAAKLNVSQSTLSVQIRRLEEQLGQRLFERRNRQLVLTEAGRIALEHADSIFAIGEELVSTLSRHGGNVPLVLRVGAIATLSRNFQIRFLAPALARPDVRIILRSGNLTALLAELEAHRIDLVLANLAPFQEPGAGWVSHLIDEQPVSLVARSERGIDPNQPIADLLRAAPLILPTGESGVRIAFDALVDRLEIHPTVAAEVDDMAMIRLLTRENVGMAIIPPIVVRDELNDGVLTEVASLPDIKEAFHAVVPLRQFPNPLVRTLIDSRDLPE